MPWSKAQLKTALAVEGVCWLWDGARQKRGYGIVNWAGLSTLAHRAIFEMLNGAVPEGMELDHVCRQRGCVNPAHLRVVTHRENINAPGAKTLNAIAASKTECPQGHPYDEANTCLSNGARVCRTCKRIRKAEWRRAHAVDARAS